MNILELADILDKDIGIMYYPNQDGRFCAMFDGCETKGDGVLSSEHGNGKTANDAINEYSNKIQGKTLVFNACMEKRMEFKCPKILENI